MSVQNAKKFIQLVQDDKAFRMELYNVEGQEAFYNFLSEKDLLFNEGEFEDAHNMLIVSCQFEEQHDTLENAINLIKLCLAQAKN